jgi:hypothetical protein
MLNDWRDDKIQFGKQSKDDSDQLLALDVKTRGSMGACNQSLFNQLLSVFKKKVKVETGLP